jgi:type II secretory pathway pseudopilin PulG
MNNRGYSILEALVAMILFAVGILALSQSYYGIMRAQLIARENEVATQLARERMESIVNAVDYADVTEANFPSEDFGEINGGDSTYAQFSRAVTVVDSTNAIGQSVLKEIIIQVGWETPAGERSVTLNSVVARHRGITL